MTNKEQSRAYRAKHPDYYSKWAKANRDSLYIGERKKSDSRQRFLDAVVKTAGCIDCGYNESAIAMDFDHVRGEKINHVARLKFASWEKLTQEIMKCDIRCANCHRIVTQERQLERMYP